MAELQPGESRRIGADHHKGDIAGMNRQALSPLE
jgi:hypothetical protein